MNISKLKHQGKCFFTFVMSILAVFSSLSAQNRMSNPATFKTNEDAVIQRLYAKGGSYYGFNPSQEVVEKRTESSKTFALGNYSFQGLYTAGPMHYEQNGRWITASNEIIAGDSKGFPFMNIHNKVKTYYGNLTQGVKFEYEGKRANLNFIGFNYYDSNKQKMSAVATYSAQAAPIATSENNFLKYNIAQNVELLLEQKTGSVQSAYEINQAIFGTDTVGFVGFTEQIIFDQAVQIAEPEKKGNVLVFVNNSGTKMLHYGNLLYFSKNSNKELKAEYITEKINNTTYRITTLVPLAWLNNPATQYPVIIDPTTTYVPNNANYWTESVEEDCGDDENINGEIWIGCRDETWPYDNELWNGIAQFNLSGLPVAVPCDIQLRMNQIGKNTGGDDCRWRVGWANVDPTVTSSYCDDLGPINNLAEVYAIWDVFGTPGACGTCNGGYDYNEAVNGWHDFNVNYPLARNRVGLRAGGRMSFGFDYVLTLLAHQETTLMPLGLMGMPLVTAPN